MGIVKNLLSINASAASLAAAMCFALPTPAIAQQARYAFDISAQDLDAALKAFGRATRLQLVYDGQAAHRARSADLKGQFTAAEGLAKLLDGSGFVMRAGRSGVFIIEARGPSTAQDDQPGTATADILVVGSRSQNLDIKRTRDDAQPYVVFDTQMIEKSQATDLNDFLRTRLPMNTAQGVSSQNAGGIGGSSPLVGLKNSTAINLRGLGENQTLILIDGRRAPAMNEGQQPDINAIPLSSIERIEILPSTAGGIYGGGAVGGVINIIRKRNYKGLDLRVGFDGPFGPDGKTFRAEASGGLSLEGGKTQVSFSASYVKSRPLYMGSNDLDMRSRVRAFERRGANQYYTPSLQATPLISSYYGDPLSLKGADAPADGAPSVTFVPLGYAGIKSDGGAALIANAGRFDPTSISGGPNGKKALLTTGSRTRSANLNIRRSFSSAIDVFSDFTYTNNFSRSNYPFSPTIVLDSDSDANPFDQAVQITYPFSQPVVAESRVRTLAANGGFIAKLGGGWMATAEYDWSQSRYLNRDTNADGQLNQAFSDDVKFGALDFMSDPAKYPIDLSPYLSSDRNMTLGPVTSVQQVMSGRISGSLLRLPGGALSLTALLERRLQRVDANTAVTANYNGTITTRYPRRTQAVNSAYIEVRAPLVSDSNAMPLIRAFELTGSLRYDGYTSRAAPYLSGTTAIPGSATKFHAYSYTVAGRWSPVKSVTFRGSYSTGFLPATNSQLQPRPVRSYKAGGSYTRQGYRDPLRQNELLNAAADLDVLTGGNPDLQPEKSKSLSAGVIFTPAFLPGFRFSADYTNIRKTGEIVSYDAAFLTEFSEFLPKQVHRRDPTDDETKKGWKGPIILLDERLINSTHSRTESYDFQADYDIDTKSAGSFHLYAVATLMTNRTQQISPLIHSTNMVDFMDGPLRWRGNAGLDWTYDKLMLSWNAQYYNSYKIANSYPDYANDINIAAQGSSRIPSQIYNDLSARYRFDSVRGVLSGVEISASVQNIFNKRPPIIVPTVGYSGYGDPRLRRFTLRLGKHF